MSDFADLSRRRFLASTAACGAGLALRPLLLGAAVAPLPVVERPWAGVWRIGDGVWAIVSTPTKANDWTTGCKGGIVANGERVLLIESFAQAAGAEWAAATARELTGRPPTDVLLTHYHGDHTGGLSGLAGDPRPRLG